MKTPRKGVLVFVIVAVSLALIRFVDDNPAVVKKVETILLSFVF